MTSNKGRDSVGTIEKLARYMVDLRSKDEPGVDWIGGKKGARIEPAWERECPDRRGWNLRTFCERAGR